MTKMNMLYHMQGMGIAVVMTFMVQGAMSEETVNCKVSDYRSGAEYDLSELENEASLAKDELGSEYIYTIFPCGHAANYEGTEPCNFPHACQHAKKGETSTMKNLGSNVFRDQIQPLVTGDGSVPQGVKLLLLDGTECNKRDGETEALNRSTEIMYHCTHGPQRVEITEPFHCVYRIFVYTPKACPMIPSPNPPSKNPCRVTNKEGLTFDLSPLKKYTGNHVIFGRDVIDKPMTADYKEEYEYIINVCQEINTNTLVAHDSANRHCHFDNSEAGICQVRYESKAPYKPHYVLVGQTTNQKLEYDEGSKSLVLKYTQGENYNHQPLTGRPRKAQIDFHCLEESGVGRPEFVREDSDGTYYFMWMTHHACPVAAVPPSASKMSGGGIFALIVFVIVPSVLLVYCLVGVIWNRSKGKTGMEMVPHIDSLRGIFTCCGPSSSGYGLSIQADDQEGKGQSLMDDDYE